MVGAALARAQKKADDEEGCIVWVDQSGFYLLPHHVRTWARCRQTPVLRVPLTREHRSAIGALSSDGRLFLQTQSGAYHSVEVLRFLRLLLRKMRGKLLIIWDGAPIHRGQPSRTSWLGEPPNASIWSNFRATRLISTQWKGSGTT